MDCSTPGLPVHHQLPELAQIHVHRVGDAIQPSHPPLSPSPLLLASYIRMVHLLQLMILMLLLTKAHTWFRFPFLKVFISAVLCLRCSRGLAKQGLLCGCRAQASCCSGFSCCGAWTPGHAGFSSCGPRAQLLQGMWDLPGPGIEPESPASQGRLPTTGLPGKVKLLSRVQLFVTPWAIQSLESSRPEYWSG